MSLLSRKRTILAKIESSYGVDPTPTGAANAILVRNLDVSPLNGDVVPRDNIRPFLGNFDQLVASTNVACTFEVELAGAGTAGSAPAYGPLLKACGMAETLNALTSAVYAPVSASFASVAIYVNVDGVLHKILGARGTWEIMITAKGIPYLRFSFVGLYSTPTDSAAPVVDYAAFQAPLVANTANTTAFSFDGFSGLLQSLSMNLGNEVVHRELIGSETVNITDRKAAGTMVIEAPLMASKNFFTFAETGDTGALSILHGSAAGNKVQIDAPRCSIGNPSYSDDNGVQMLTLAFSAVPSSAGNDELTLTVK